MLDIGKVFGPDGWGSIAFRVRKDEDPELTDLASKLRGTQPVPQEVRNYLADLLEGTRKRKRGPKSKKLSAGQVLKRMYLVDRVHRFQRVFEWQKRRGDVVHEGPYRAALHHVSEEFSISEYTLDKWVYPRRKRK